MQKAATTVELKSAIQDHFQVFEIIGINWETEKEGETEEE